MRVPANSMRIYVKYLYTLFDWEVTEKQRMINTTFVGQAQRDIR
jgi:hypothetical protein